MPRFSANLGFLFNEVPFLERFGEAAHAGFRAVEFAFPYDVQVEGHRGAASTRHKLEVVLINAPPGDWDSGRARPRVARRARARVRGGHGHGAALRAGAALPAAARDGRQ